MSFRLVYSDFYQGYYDPGYRELYPYAEMSYAELLEDMYHKRHDNERPTQAWYEG